MKSILDPKFKYTSSVDTDLKKMFARVRREQAKAKVVVPTPSNVVRAIRKTK